MAKEEKKQDTDKVDEEPKQEKDPKEAVPAAKEPEAGAKAAPKDEKKKKTEEAKLEAPPAEEPESEKDETQSGEAVAAETPEPAAAAEEKASSVRLDDLNFFSPVREDLPQLKPGDVIRVSYRVIEGGKERIQVFEGTVIALKHSGIARTITVRKTSFGISVERIFPLNSKLLSKIEVKKHSKVRRAKLYYLRKLKGKAARLKELR